MCPLSEVDTPHAGLAAEDPQSTRDYNSCFSGNWSLMLQYKYLRGENQKYSIHYNFEK